MSDLQKFWAAFETQNHGQAIEYFLSLKKEYQNAIFAELFQKSRYQKMPNAISILFRKLNKDKNFEDFHASWFPPADQLNSVKQYGQRFEQFFPTPTRVINAVNWQNPKEIVSIGLHWISKAQYEPMMAVINSASNQERSEKINKVADKGKTGIYAVKTDENLGTPF